MKNLYNEDGTLSTEAQFLLSPKPENMSVVERRNRFKIFKNQLSQEELKEFQKLYFIQRGVIWRTNNPEKARSEQRKRQARWIKKNPERAKTIQAKSYKKNSEKQKLRTYSWISRNPEKHKQTRNSYSKIRRNDPLFRFYHSLRSSTNRVIKQLALGKKPANTLKWVGCSAEELKVYFESLFKEGMTWDNYGEWHVDHIRPVSSFTAQEWEQVNHYSNLQPLWAKDNLSKGNKY